MSGTAVIRYLLANNAPVVAVVPATRIMAGTLPLNTVLPAIVVSQVDSIPTNFIRVNTSGRNHSDRVQVSAIFKLPEQAGAGVPGLDALMKLLIPACPSQRGTINGIVVEAITPDIEGPHLEDIERALISCSRDFIVRWVGT